MLNNAHCSVRFSVLQANMFDLEAPHTIRNLRFMYGAMQLFIIAVYGWIYLKAKNNNGSVSVYYLICGSYVGS